MEFYDVGASDLRELWDTYLVEPALGTDILMMNCRDEEWGVLSPKDKTGVVLRDRLMTDAAIGGPKPIKTEHSYSLLACSPPPSPATPGANPHIPNSDTSAGSTTIISCSSDAPVQSHKPMELRSRIDVVDMEEECFPAISMNTASSREPTSPAAASAPSPPPNNNIESSKLTLVDENGHFTTIKGEPISEPGSPCEPCHLVEDKSTITMVEPHRLHFTRSSVSQTSESDDDEDEIFQEMDIDEFKLTCGEGEKKFSVSRQTLPPTPPSSASSDSEGTASASCSPERRDPQSSTHVQNLRGLLTPRLYVSNGIHTHTTTTTRQPIHTPLISCQPKGSTGILTLTEEEKRTLVAEGYPVPAKLPLTKQEEKSLKKIRRKIKNKISAQESRRKKKEYMDGLERRVTILTNENSSYRDRLTVLEDSNRELLKELHRLQAHVQLRSS